MWVADMNFPTVPTIPEAIIERVKHPAYGYFVPRDEYYEEIMQWHEKRNSVTGLKKEHIGYENGVLGGVVSALNVLCSKGDSVLLHSPTYIGFTGSLTNNGYSIVLSPLVQDDKGMWRMDLEDMERKIIENKIHAAILCSPHNPTGRVWEREELEKMMELYRKHDVYVVSDEIWSDLILTGHKHIPAQSVSEDAKQRTIDELQTAGLEVGVLWQDGRPFHCPFGIRLNLALPLSRVKEAFDRLDKYVFNANVVN